MVLVYFVQWVCEAILFRVGHSKTFLRSWYWKYFIQRRGGEVGHSFRLLSGVGFSIGEKATVRIGNGVILSEGALVFVGSGGKLFLGDGVYIGRGTTVIANQDVRVGERTQIAHLVTLIDSDHRFDDYSRPIVEQGGVTGRIKIGTDVWIGTGAIVLKNVEIGEHAVVGAGTVVTKSISPKTTVVGNPARSLSSHSTESTP